MNSPQHLSHSLTQLNSEGPCTEKKRMCGPTPTSNFIIPELIVCGDAPRASKLHILVEAGVRHFVDLRNNEDNYVRMLLEQIPPQQQSQLRYTHFPLQQYISSCSAESVAAVASFLKRIVAEAIMQREIAYIHCTDGIALTSVATCGILSFVYGLSGMKGIAFASQLIGCREMNDGVTQVLSASLKGFVKTLTSTDGSITMPHSTGSLHSSQNDLQDQVGQCPQPTGGRFGATKGHGGGESHFNIFSTEPAQNTPSRRGRAVVPGMSQETVRIGSRPQSQANTTPPVAERSARPAAVQQQPLEDQVPPHHHSAFSIVAEPQRTTLILKRPSPRTSWGIEVRGVTVTAVDSGSCAAAAGLQTGSILEEIDGERFQLDDDIEEQTAGKTCIEVRIDPTFQEHFIRHSVAPQSLASCSARQRRYAVPRTHHTVRYSHRNAAA